MIKTSEVSETSEVSFRHGAISGTMFPLHPEASLLLWLFSEAARITKTSGLFPVTELFRHHVPAAS